MDNRKLKTLIRIMQSHGVRSLKLDGLELTLDERFMAPPVAEEFEPKAEAPADPAVVPQYTSEDALFWSAPGMEA